MVKNKENGSIVYANTAWNTAEKCEIAGIFENSYKLHSLDNSGTFFCSPHDVYETVEEAVHARNKQSEQAKNNYKKEIGSMDSLVDFCLERMASAGEYTNYEAIDAVKERYAELREELDTDYFDEYCK